MGELVSQYLRKLYPHHTAEYVARDLDRSPATVRKWLDRSSVPGAGTTWQMADVYGLDFVTFVFPGLAWLKELAALASRETAAQRLAEAEAVVAELRGARK